MNDGNCCIDYNKYGCSKDNDCCYSNSYCQLNIGLCRRRIWQRDNENNDASYDGSESDEQEFYFQNEFDAKQNEQERIINFDNLNVEQLRNLDINDIHLSLSIKIILIVILLLIFGNILCCIHQKIEKSRTSKRIRFAPKINKNNVRIIDISSPSL